MSDQKCEECGNALEDMAEAKCQSCRLWAEGFAEGREELQAECSSLRGEREEWRRAGLLYHKERNEARDSDTQARTALAECLELLEEVGPENSGGGPRVRSWFERRDAALAADTPREPTVYDEVREERKKQDAEWGGPEHDDQHDAVDWLAFMRAHMKRARRINLDGETQGCRYQMIRVAALAIAGVESFDRIKATSQEGTGEPPHLDHRDIKVGECVHGRNLTSCRWCRRGTGGAGDVCAHGLTPATCKVCREPGGEG